MCKNPCDLIKGYCKPYEGDKSKFLLISESPSNSTLINYDTSIFWDLMAKYGFTKNMFKIGYSVNCYLKGRPSEYHRDCCRSNLIELFNSFDPKMVIISGNFALHTLTDRWGIKKYEYKIEKRLIFRKYYNIMYWQNVNTMLYSKNIENCVKKLCLGRRE